MIAILLFITCYTINMFYISVLYHRGLAHRSVGLGPNLRKFIEKTGIWVTGLDPLSWVLMHRIHHLYSDQEKDPHSPLNGGIFKVWVSQYKSYLYFMERMKLRDNATYNDLMKDIKLRNPKLVDNKSMTNRNFSANQINLLGYLNNIRYPNDHEQGTYTRISKRP